MEPRIEAVILDSVSPEALVAFYREGFGLAEPKWHGENHVGMMVGSVYFGIDRVVESPGGSGAVSIWFWCEDVEKKAGELIQLGARMIREADYEESPSEVLCVVGDLDGNRVGLIGKVALS